MRGKSKDEVKGLTDGDMTDDQSHIDRIDKSIKGVERQIADATTRRQTELIEALGVSTTGTDPKAATPSEFEPLSRIGLLLEDKHTAVEADKIRTWMTNFLTKHSKQFWAVLPIIHRMLSMNPNRDTWKVPTADEICSTNSDYALAATGVGRLVSEYFNQQNMDLLTLMHAGKNCLKLIEAAQQELTHGGDKTAWECGLVKRPR